MFCLLLSFYVLSTGMHCMRFVLVASDSHHPLSVPLLFLFQKQSKWAAREKEMDPKILAKWKNRAHQQYITFMQTYADSLKSHSKKRLMSFREVAVASAATAASEDDEKKEPGKLFAVIVCHYCH